MTQPEFTWWPTFVDRLKREPLTVLSDEYGVEVDTLAMLLAEAGEGMAADASPWWPEAVRMLGSSSIRAVARFFQTEPRRVRRGLARDAARVHGVDLADGQGYPTLVSLREELGQKGDRAVARSAGVIPEAVQGERRRLGIPAFHQKGRVKLSRDEEEWIRGPKKERRARTRGGAEELEVVRRPHRNDAPAPVVTVGRSFGAEDRPRPLEPRSLLSRPVEAPARPVEVPRPFEARPAPDGVIRRPLGGPPLGLGADRPAVERLVSDRPASDRPGELRHRDFFRSERENEIDRLLQPVRHREGPRRLVRAEPARPALEEAAPLGVIRRRVADGSGPAGGEAPAPVRRRVVAEPEVRHLVRPEAPAPVRRVVAAPAPAPAAPVRRVAEPARPVAPPPRKVSRPRALAEELAPVVDGNVVLAVEPEVVVESAPALEWLVFLPGSEAPLRVWASDIGAAAAQAASLVSPELLAHASIWRADEAAPVGGAEDDLLF